MVYVGCSNHIGTRWLTHTELLAACLHTNEALAHHWKNYGNEDLTFRKVQTVRGGRQALLEAEAKWMMKFSGRLMNSTAEFHLAMKRLGVLRIDHLG